MNKIVDMPYDLLEYTKCQILINQIIDKWFEDHKDIFSDEDGSENFNKILIVSCMISYRRLMHDKLELEL